MNDFGKAMRSKTRDDRIHLVTYFNHGCMAPLSKNGQQRTSYLENSEECKSKSSRYEYDHVRPVLEIDCTALRLIYAIENQVSTLSTKRAVHISAIELDIHLWRMRWR